MLHKSLIDKIHIRSGGAYEDSKGSVYPLHMHDHWELVYYRRGEVVTTIDGMKYEVHPGVIMLTPPGEAHTDYGATACSNFFIGLDIDADPQQVSRRFLDDGQNAIRDCCQAIVNELNHHNAYRSEMLRCFEDQLLILIERAHQAEQEDEHHIITTRQMIAYMPEHLSEPIRIQDIAAAHHSAVSTMRDWFYKLYDCSPQQYLSKLRFDQARELIGSSDLKLAAVARTCGFDSISHLSRAIKKRTGMSPGALRKQLQNA